MLRFGKFSTEYNHFPAPAFALLGLTSFNDVIFLLVLLPRLPELTEGRPVPHSKAKWKITAVVGTADKPDDGMSSRKLDWSYYRGLEEWNMLYPECGWFRQSPINIGKNDIGRHRCPARKKIRFLGFDKPIFGRFLIDNHHASFIPDVKNLTLVTNFLTKDYLLEKVVFHWGSMDDKGSEHQLYGNRYPFEIQLIHKPIDEGFDMGERVAVSILATISGTPNRHLKPFIDGFVSAALYKPFAEIRPPVQFQNVLPSHDEFFVYPGSLPYPPCTEEVTWIVLKRATSISPSQLRQLRGIYHRYPELRDNFRPPQPLNRRIVETERCYRQLNYREEFQPSPSPVTVESVNQQPTTETIRPTTPIKEESEREQILRPKTRKSRARNNAGSISGGNLLAVLSILCINSISKGCT